MSIYNRNEVSSTIGIYIFLKYSEIKLINTIK
ncbi:MAG: hypothetical protein QG657_962 [Acidobacteriota bacterium]|nr:hypothetical protein [Acidobacteriota bacterium]